MKKSTLFIFIVCMYMIPVRVSATVTLSEIMYDLDGTDTGREWIEIFNGGSAIDITGFKLFEANTNHGISTTSPNQSFTIPASGYAIIADNPTKFLVDWPSFSGILFDSSFSLSNIGETLSLLNSELVEEDSVMYTSLWGGNGDGNSLHATDGGWVSTLPNPGTGNSTTTNEPDMNDVREEEETTLPSSNTTSFPVEPQIFAFAGDDRTVTVGADTEFKGRVKGLSGEQIAGARFAWSFGDGVQKEGQNVLHYYRYPGEYVVVLETSSGEYASSDRLYISVLPAQLKITDASPESIELLNESNREINLSWWMFLVNNTSFTIPGNTIILPKHSVIFSSEVTKLLPNTTSDVLLMYPNGKVVDVTHSVSGEATAKTIPIGRAIVGSTLEIPIVSTPYISETSGEGDISEPPQSASVVLAEEGVSDSKGEEGTHVIPWLSSVLGIVILASLSAVYLRREERRRIRIID